MTSNDTSSPSPKTTMRVPTNYEQLLGQPKKLRAVVRTLGTAGWEDLEQWFLAERQEHLERSVDSDNAEDREGHRVVARWLKHFIQVVKVELLATELAERHPEPEPVTEYMPHDSESSPRGIDFPIPGGPINS